MAKLASDASWQCDDGHEIHLSGSWTLLLDADRHRRLAHELGALAAPRSWGWNLERVEALDSAGARLLWVVWGQQLPERLVCRQAHRHWFRWLADTRTPEPATRHHLDELITHAANGILGMGRATAGMLILIGQLMLDMAYCARHPRVIPWREITATIHHVGATSMLLLGCVGFLIGIVMTIQIGMALRQFGAGLMIVQTMGLAVLRELGPVICGLILAGRSGSAMTAGIGAMHVTGEYDALRAFGASPSLRLALPRVLGAGISMPLLVVWTDFAALIGSAATAQVNLDISYWYFLAALPEQVQIVNFWIGLAKGALFGLTIAIVGCYFGMSAPADTAALSRHTTLSVVTSLTLILLFDASSGALLTHVGLL